MIVYAALYCPMRHESASGIISLHETQEGAEKALEAHRSNRIKQVRTIVEWQSRQFDTVDEIDLDAEMRMILRMESWSIKPYKIQT